MILCVVIAAAWWMFPRDPVAILREHSSPLAFVTRAPHTQGATPLERWTLHSLDGRRAQGLWRPAPRDAREPWTVVLLGGIGTGATAATLIPPHLPIHVLAMEWPWDGPLELSDWDFARNFVRIRRAALRSPGVLALGLEAVAHQSDVDPRRVALVGVSLGVPPAVAALTLTDVPSALVLVDGAADLAPAVERGLQRRGLPGPVSWALSRFLHRLGRPLEPTLHAATAKALPVLIFNARRDNLLPTRSIERLHDVLAPADVRWRGGVHMRPERAEVIRTLVVEATTWLEGLTPPEPVADAEDPRS